MHYVVVTALKKDGWHITHDSFLIRFNKRRAEIDLGAEKLLAAEKDTEKILIEIKSFLSGSAFSEFHTALGQFNNYRRLVKLKGISRKLYLAMPTDVYEELLTDEFGKLTVEEEDLQLLLYNPYMQTVDRWIK